MRRPTASARTTAPRCGATEPLVIDPGRRARLGITPAARSAMASRTRSLGDPRRRGHAATDPGRPGDPQVEGVPGAYPRSGRRAQSASLADVLRLWQGLGYPRRARNLRTTAELVGDRHGGRLPDDLDALLALPGIGPYTARAVLAFAFERDVGVVDTNIARVLARTVGERLTPKRAQACRRRCRAARARLDLEPGDDGPRCHPVPSGAALRGLSAGSDMRVAPRRTSRSRPVRGFGRGEHSAGPIRRQRPPGPRSSARSAPRWCASRRRVR